jgi:hypothetical protein
MELMVQNPFNGIERSIRDPERGREALLVIMNPFNGIES